MVSEADVVTYLQRCWNAANAAHPGAIKAADGQFDVVNVLRVHHVSDTYIPSFTSRVRRLLYIFLSHPVAAGATELARLLTAVQAARSDGDDFSNLAVGTSLVLVTTLTGAWDDPGLDPADTFVTADVAGRRWGLCAMTSGVGAGDVLPLVFSSTGADGSVSWVVKEVVREDLGMLVGAFATHVANVELAADGRIKYVNNATNVFLTGLHVLGDEVKFTITRVTDTTHDMSIVVNGGTPTTITGITNAGTRNWRAANPVTALTLVLPIIGTFYITDITPSWIDALTPNPIPVHKDVSISHVQLHRNHRETQAIIEWEEMT